MEVFAKFPFDNRVDLKDKSTMWTTTCRLVSLALRFDVPMNEIIKQLDRSSGHMLDLVLIRYQDLDRINVLHVNFALCFLEYLEIGINNSHHFLVRAG